MADARVTAAEAQGRRKSLLQGSPPTTDTDTETETETEIDTGYAELHCLSNFSFQRGASHPEELVERASRLGYAALAITDECSVAGVSRNWLTIVGVLASIAAGLLARSVAV